MTSDVTIENAALDGGIQSAQTSGSSQIGNLSRLSIIQLLNFCIGFIGIQFAWSMQIGLSARVTEPLGATPLIFGLIWLAGPITGILVQPIVGVLSDNTWTKIGRRRPFLIAGTILGSLALIAFPNAALIAKHIHLLPAIGIAALFLWIIDASVNTSMGPYRALVPDIAPTEQQAVTNSYIGFAVGAGSVIAFAFAPVVKMLFHYQMSIAQQFTVGAAFFITTILWTVITTPEKHKPVKTAENTESSLAPVRNFGISAVISLVITGIIFVAGHFSLSNKDSIVELLSWFVLILSIPMLTMALKSFSSKEAYKLCAMQFFTWLGMMCLFIYFNNFVVHNIFMVPDLSTATEAVKAQFNSKVLDATNVSQLAFLAFNIVCLIVALPLGYICNRLGKKKVHSFALFTMAMAFLGLALAAKNPLGVYVCLGIAGIGWGSMQSLPYALLVEHIKPGTEGSAMGKFNLFIAGPQILSSVAVGYLITTHPLKMINGSTHHWEYAFLVGAASVILASIITLTIHEKCKSLDVTKCPSGGH